MFKSKIKVYRVVTTETEVGEVTAYFTTTRQFMLDPSELQHLPAGTYLAKGDVLMEGKSISIRQEVTIS